MSAPNASSADYRRHAGESRPDHSIADRLADKMASSRYFHDLHRRASPGGGRTRDAQFALRAIAADNESEPGFHYVTLSDDCATLNVTVNEQDVPIAEINYDPTPRHRQPWRLEAYWAPDFYRNAADRPFRYHESADDAMAHAVERARAAIADCAAAADNRDRFNQELHVAITRQNAELAANPNQDSY